MRRFTAEHISDQKRLVRGEHWLLARTRLRARDGIHHRRWRILTLAGEAPRGELACIRELMPQAHIVAVDRSTSALEAARSAGADEVIECDLFEWSYEETAHSTLRRAAAPIQSRELFDVINLDLCGCVTDQARDLSRVYRTRLTTNGVMILTFSYGRDVTERYLDRFQNWSGLHFGDERNREKNRWRLTRLGRTKLPPVMIGRLLCLFNPSRLDDIRSVMVYRGANMPMCSVLLQQTPKIVPISVVSVQPFDLDVAASYPNTANLYDVPQERMAAFRRRYSALKAIETGPIKPHEGGGASELKRLPLFSE